MSELITLTLQQTTGVYGVDQAGNPWATVRYSRGSKPYYKRCDACQRRFHRGYLRRNTGRFVCPQHIRLVSA